MSDSREQPWSDNPNAPKIPHYVYIEEKCKFAEVVISSVLYGMPKTPPPTRPSIRDYFICLVCSRNHDRSILSIYGRVVQPRPPQTGGVHQVGTRILHRGHVLACYRTNSVEP